MCRRITFPVVFFCKKTKLNKKGKAPIYARISEVNIGNEISGSERKWYYVFRTDWPFPNRSSMISAGTNEVI